MNHCRPAQLLENVGGDREVFLQLAEIFRRESVTIFDKMRSAAGMCDFEELGRQSHSLKGTVGPLGADELLKILLQIEDECDDRQCICDENRLTVIDDALSQIKLELKQFIDQF